MTTAEIAKALGMDIRELELKVEASKDTRVWINGKGETVPASRVQKWERIREDKVTNIIRKAERANRLLKKFKKSIYEDIEDYIDTLRREENIDVTQNSKKGGLSLQNYSKTQKVAISTNDIYILNEKVLLAKECLTEYLREKAELINDEDITDLVSSILDAKEISVTKARALKQRKITHPLWVKAIKLIDEASEISETKRYLSFAKRGVGESEWKRISLEFSSLNIDEV